MTHPLTDEVCDQITDELSIFSIEDCMRSATDWQLEQVIQAWDECKQGPWYSPQVIYRFEQKLKAMRPQEDNQ